MNQCTGFELLNGLLKEQMLQLLPTQGRKENIITRLALTRHDSAIPPEQCLYSPMIAYVVQGTKRSFYGEIEANYGEGQCVILGAAVPGIYQIKGASTDKPFLSLSVKLDNHIISHPLPEIPAMPDEQKHPSASVGIMHIDMNLLDAFRRLISLVARPLHGKF